MATCFCCSPSHLFCHFFDWLHTGAVQVVVVLPRLDEQMVLNRFLHFFPWRYEMIVSVIHFVISLWSRRVWKWKWKFNRDASITGRIRDLTISLQCFTFQTKHNICKHTNTHTHTHTHTWTLFSNVNTIRKYSSRAFVWVVAPLDFVGQFRI